MILSKEDIRHLVDRVRSGMAVKHACGHIKLTQSYEDFSNVMLDAIFDVWIRIGDSGYNKSGYRTAFDAVENEFFTKEKEIKNAPDNEHLMFYEYF